MNYPYENLENFTLPSLLNRSVKLYETQDILAKVGQTPMTYTEFDTAVQKTVLLLKGYGIKKGDKILLLSENMPNWGVAYFAVTYFGAVIVPVLPDFHPSDVHRIMKHSEIKAVFVSSKHQQTIENYGGSNNKFVLNLDSLTLVDKMCNVDYIYAVETNTQDTTPHEDDLAALIYTSGTTGNSKGVMLSHKNLVTNAMSAYIQVQIKKEDVFMSILPLAHTFECTVGLIVPILHGSSVHYIDKVPTPSVLLKAFKIVRPTMMVSVPLIIEKIYKSKVLPKFTGSFLMRTLYSIGFIRKRLNKIAGKKLIETFGGRLRFFGVGGAGISPYVEQFLIEAEFPFIVGYGLTETSPLIAGSVLGAKVKHRSTGIAMAGVEIAIENKDPKTGHGEIIARSPSIMMGYFKDEEKTAEVMQDDWFLTGDLGYLDEDGFLFISGRSKNVLIGSGGENIYPEQIEATINQNESVVDSLVMMDKNQKLIALINLDEEKIYHEEKNREEYLENMRKDVNAQVSSFSRMVKFIEEKEPFVKTPTKKIKRFLYADKY
ncbi:AMP-binding protein [Sulfurimonas sp. SAG-AH-194-I05]|nr:AMP-binding protein [Sulfurimonas sp. SAG-AH-194-I05]MDF1876111.1 AMP-binding protein [Sulfurimonas sp. SAG-AH-194-I05]